MDGMLLVDKPKDWTSFDVVNYIRKIIATAEGKKPRHIKVGHIGTLDPLATGLLVLLIGNYTKRASGLSGLDKVYTVTAMLGQTSTTGDGEGDKIITSDDKPTQEEIENTLQLFTGNIMQTPPIYSAIKVNGQRAYKLARAGKEVKLVQRPVTVYYIKIDDYSYPEIRFTTKVSSGTYIRSLVEDIGRNLGTGAYMSDLCRTKIGEFDIEEAISPLNLDMQRIDTRLRLAE